MLECRGVVAEPTRARWAGSRVPLEVITGGDHRQGQSTHKANLMHHSQPTGAEGAEAVNGRGRRWRALRGLAAVVIVELVGVDRVGGSVRVRNMNTGGVCDAGPLTTQW
jgi:hypothetical protein